MRVRALLSLIAIAVTAFVFTVRAGSLRAQSTTAMALAGVVSSAEEGPMEGVVVSAWAPNATITTSVVTDEKGRYSFPASHLVPGSYGLSIRATGYLLNAAATAAVAAQKTTVQDLRLRKTPDIAFQLTDAEWVNSAPGTQAQKRPLLNCDSCHSLQRVFMSTYGAKEFMAVIPRMATYVNQSTAVHPQKRYAPAPRAGMNPQALEQLANYLETVNLHDRSYWTYELKALPRPKGAATHVIYTEYKLPRAVIEPHDVVVENGMVYYSYFGEQYVGKLDPATGKASEFPIPTLKKGWPTGTLDLEPDKAGNLWISGMYQGGVFEFDPKTETTKAWPLPADMNGDTAQQSMVMPNNMHVDGVVWTNNQDQHVMLKLDSKTGQWKTLGPFDDPEHPGRKISAYGVLSDSQNNGYFLDFGPGGQAIVKIDAKTNEMSMFETPTKDSWARRGRINAQDQMVFAEYGANGVATLDLKSGAFHEYKIATPWANPYDAFQDKNGEIWAGSMWDDRIVRINPKTNQSLTYLLPRFTNIRRVFVDNTTTPVTFWTSNNHGASIIKLETLP
jgi:virginiamycin B lyase